MKIYQLDNGFAKWEWLCGKCLAKRKADGWEVKQQGKLPSHDLDCDECGVTG